SPVLSSYFYFTLPLPPFSTPLSLHDALPILFDRFGLDKFPVCFREYADMLTWFEPYHTVLDTSDAPFWKWFAGGKINASNHYQKDRKSTRLNSSHVAISYAVFCLKKKTKITI